MVSSAVAFCSVLCLSLALVFLQLLRLQLQTLGRVPKPALDLAPDRPEALLEFRLAREQEPSARAALHAALAQLHTAALRPKEALEHFEAARDAAVTAAMSATPPLKLGEAVVWAGKEREEQANRRLALAQAYLACGRAADAEIALEPQLSQLVGLDPVSVASLQRVAGLVKLELGKFDSALRYQRFARERLQRVAHGDPEAEEELARTLRDEAKTQVRRGSPAAGMWPAKQGLALLQKGPLRGAAVAGGSAKLKLAQELHQLIKSALSASDAAGSLGEAPMVGGPSASGGPIEREGRSCKR
mmetsp:Transcript_57658/g.134295  ORF Transcript_57658/g.134295 Transcript_57658/m.134295 type:complete len:302 (+) Transcript_57658:70-975(+)|eukprot:CAMPEP_0171104298 /NCGR_PEP_ID=MMETSP0766_2-20121228/60366_1 /TAXON_ID=439317 /ORGANISM="Gambierdiscus australes, Strain CAWD 149" /LENGTH=301 /DNA_ID=CAMNT_0011564903 /DNA_START=65 /DNA_END=970 /DNA_ORIENTATION=-